MSTLSVPFSWRGRPAAVVVTVEPNTDPVALGCDLLDPALAADAATGYPVCRAVVESEWAGYAACCGWVQLVRSTDGEDGPDRYGYDPLTLFREVDLPYMFFGVEPVLFDAPFRGDRLDLDWAARSYLCATPDGVMSRVVEPLAAFSWGFQVRDGHVTIDEPTPLALATWDEHVPLLAGRHPAWTFRSAG
jgi:hypothetical protein